MIERYQYNCQGVCSRAIQIELEGEEISHIQFIGGCMGNTQGVAALSKGRKIDDVISTLEGIDCGGKGTSCPDQLANALRLIKAKRAQNTQPEANT